MRAAAVFGKVALADLVREVGDMYEPIAEENRSRDQCARRRNDRPFRGPHRSGPPAGRFGFGNADISTAVPTPHLRRYWLRSGRGARRLLWRRPSVRRTRPNATRSIE